MLFKDAWNWASLLIEDTNRLQFVPRVHPIGRCTLLGNRDLRDGDDSIGKLPVRRLR